MVRVGCSQWRKVSRQPVMQTPILSVRQMGAQHRIGNRCARAVVLQDSRVCTETVDDGLVDKV